LLYEHNPVDDSRRSLVVSSLLSAIAISTAPTRTSAADAALPTIGGAKQSARVAEWPGIDSLEPMYELKVSIDALVNGVAEPKNWPFVEKRLDKFFQGGLFSEKNFYFGVGLQYMNDMKYDKSELPSYVILDKETRYAALEETMKSLERLKSTLSSPNASVIKDVIRDNAIASQTALASWFALLPQGDVAAVQQLFQHVQMADTNRDGKLSDNELELLSPLEQELWKKRVKKFG